MSGCHEPINKECHCKCHVSQNEHCDMCSPIDCSSMLQLIHKLQNNIDALEHLVKKNWEVNYKRGESFGKRIIGLEEMVGKLIDEKDHNSDHGERIHYLEEIGAELRLIRLESRLQSDDIQKKPHKCPVCDGRRCVPEIGNPPHLDMCLVCNGKGIVWG